MNCERCGADFNEHGIYHDEIPAGSKHQAAIFGGAAFSGLFCPRRRRLRSILRRLRRA